MYVSWLIITEEDVAKIEMDYNRKVKSGQLKVIDK